MSLYSPKTTYECDGLRWIDLSNPSNADLLNLQREFHFHPLDLEDVSKDRQRPKLIQHTDYLFLEVHLPVYDPKNRKTVLSYVDFFVTHDHVITIHIDHIPALEEFKKAFSFSRIPVDSQHKAGFLFASLLEELFRFNFRKLDHVSKKLDAVDQSVFTNEERNVVEEILYIKRDLIGFRRILRPHRSLLLPLLQGGGDLFTPPIIARLHRVVDLINEEWEMLDNLSDMARSLDTTTHELLSYKVNQKMKVITFLSTLLFPLGTFFSILRLDLPGNPFIDIPNMYFIAMTAAFCFIVFGFVYFYMKKMF